MRKKKTKGKERKDRGIKNSQKITRGGHRRIDRTDEAVKLIESARLLNKRMFQALFPDAKIITERVFLLPKSFIAIKE